jgi:O-antigen/teichoic acid export membrane protein
LTPEVRRTIRQTGGVALLRLVEMAGGALLITFVPRLMGPEIYGQFSLLLAMSIAFALLNGMASASVTTHFVPGFMERGDYAGLRKFASNFLALRVAGGVAAAAACLVVLILWLPSLSFPVLVATAACVFARSVANLPFAILLGMNRAAQWSAAEALRRGLIAPAAFFGFRWDGLRGACLSLLASEVFVLTVGLWWGRGFLSWSEFRIDRPHLRPYLQFNTAFLAATLMSAVYIRMGGPMVHLLTGEFEEVAFYSVAYGAYLTAQSAISTMLNSLGPMFSSFRLRGERERLRAHIERILMMCGLLSVIVAAGAYCFSDAVIRTVLGSGYLAVVPLLRWLSLAGIVMVPAEIGRVLAVVENQPRISTVAGTLQLTIFIVLTLSLMPFKGPSGIVLAIVFATAAFALYITIVLRKYTPYSVNQWLGIVMLAAVCSPLLWAWQAHPILRWTMFHVVFMVLAFLLGIVRAKDLTGSWSAIRAAAHPERP